MPDIDTQRNRIADAFGDAIEEEGFSPEGFTILDELDRGGMAAVYLAEQHEPSREVALKVLLPRYAGEVDMHERFNREGQAMANLEHNGILPVYQVGNWDGLSFIAMKLATGGSLKELLHKGLPEVRQAVDWIFSAGEAVHFAHQRAVLHRDLKPANLLFDHDGIIYVADFGVAKVEFTKNKDLTDDNALIGTPNYLAPEVASGEANGGSVASDLYGLGAILYECLTGKRAHESSENLAAQLRAIVDQDIISVKKINPSVPVDLCVICEKALAKNPTDRYGSVLEFVEDLGRWRDGLPIIARPVRLAEKVLLWSRRHPLPAALSLVLLLTIVAASIAFMVNYQKQGELLRERGELLQKQGELLVERGGLIQKQGELLRESIIERARGERLIREPGFRERVLSLLHSAHTEETTKRIQEEAVAALAFWDTGDHGEDSLQWVGASGEAPFSVEESEKGLLLVNEEGSGDVVIPLLGALRCPAVCSADGKFVAAVSGERMEIMIYDASRNGVYTTIALENWPKQIVFAQSEELLKVIFENGEANLFNIQGKLLLEGFGENDALVKPVGITFWKGNYLTPVEASLYGGRLTSDENFLVTTSAIGVQVWDVQTQSQVEFYEVENQRVDAPTDAWWLDNRRLLIQVPGAQEILTINNTGKVSKVTEVKRIPGSKIKNIYANGDWHVELRNEDGLTEQKLWIGGDPEREKKWQTVEGQKEIKKAGTVDYNDWKITLPTRDDILDVFILDKGKRVLVTTVNYDIFEWNLENLSKELQRLKLKYP